ncbi:unnamed protein product [Clonostachys rosea]|uniref:Carrier domain-containing protein n=1 Tax=Bionectria ochroleuca TaxID=29856 RepID=A0ABY6TWR3_BIOOC|nr:unnamed protein product [Clonostachys rosea]
MASISDQSNGSQHPSLFPQMVDQLADSSPDAIYGQWPIKPTSHEAGFRTITYAQLANIVNGLARWLVDQLGPGKSGRPLAYIGPNDVRTSALVLATIKAGYGVPAAHQALFDALGIQVLLSPEPTPPAANSVLDTLSPLHVKVPSIDNLLETKHAPYAYTKTWQQGRSDPIWIIHTSGSTGIPKPLVWTQDAALRNSAWAKEPAPPNTQSIDSLYLGKRVMVTLPPFHGAGIGQFFFYGIPSGTVIIAPATSSLVSAEGLVDSLTQTPADVALLVPSVVAELAQKPALLDYCAKNLQLLVYIGGNLPQALGDVVAAKIPLRCQWGASEVGMPQQLMPAELDPQKDWRYTRFHPSTGAVFEEVANGLYELVIRRRLEAPDTQTTFAIGGKEKVDEYHTSDLFTPHPTVPDTWAWAARTDDIIVLLNGEKTNPISMEHHITASNPELAATIVIGTQRFQTALLIEPVHSGLTTAQQAALIERVWPSVEEANRAAPAHARVEKSLVMITTPDRPLIRAGKGTLQRAASLAQYAAEIDKLYENMEALDEDDDIAVGLEPMDNVDAVSQRIWETIRTVTGWLSLDDSTNFFEQGLDSLQALQIVRALRHPGLSLSTVYRNPTVSQLTAAITTVQTDETKDLDMMKSLLDTYSGLIAQIPARTAISQQGESAAVDVILTGSTGTLGTYILHALLKRKGIGQVFCLNRGPDGGMAVQTDRFITCGFTTNELKERVSFIKTDLAHPKLGLDDVTYETLRTRVGLLIHNAWPVNFNLPLSAFQPQLAGVVNLFALATAATAQARVLFVSSVASVAGLLEPAPEAISVSYDTPGANGYARSKFLSEHLCDAAARHLGIPVSIARVGQVAGPVNAAGAWNRTEWLPSLVASSSYLGCLPDNLGPRFSDIDWIPSDLLGDVLADLAVINSSTTRPVKGIGAEVFNLRNPKTTTWDVLLLAVKGAVLERLGRELDVVPPSLWLERLHQSSSESSGDDLATSVASNPAMKLMGFYRDALWESGPPARPMSINKALSASPTLSDMPRIRLDWMRKWVSEWLV